MYIFGASGHGKVIASVLLANNIDFIGFIDDNPALKQVMNQTVLNSNAIENLQASTIVIGIGDNVIRKKVAERIQGKYLTVIHKSAVICKTVVIGKGTVVFPNAVINAEATIGSQVIINTGAVVEHDCVLDNFVHISPNAAIAGGVNIGEGTHIGIGASIIQGVTIGKWATIGAGAVIINDIPDGAVVVGNPGKIIKLNS